ncbi:MAG: TonB-dependent receptor [Acidobacteria bacterium]|nr:TonB-dependent receptor [Acidobacteriota bacterium]
MQGTFRYNVGNEVRSVDLLALASRSGQTTTIDPVIGRLLSDIRAATTTTGGITQLTDPNLQRFSYSPSGMGLTRRPTVRFDFNLSDRHQIDASWNYLQGRGKPDFLNNTEPPFPGFPNQGAQPADRYSGAVGLRSTLSSRLVNEFRAGLSGGPSRFNPEASAATFLGPVANQGGFALNMNGAANITNAHAVTAPSRRNPLFRDISDTLNWTRGAHSLSIGAKYTWITLTYNAQTLVPTVNFGVNTNDPAISMFTAANFPGAASADLTRAQNIYAVLTGRVTAINANVRLDENTGKYVYLGNAVERSRQQEVGLFVQDSWRVRSGLTLNYGLRWEVQGPFHPLNSSYTTVSVDDLWGISGSGNLFRPGVMTGRTTQFVQFKKGDRAYATDYGNFAPSFGFAWSPNPSGNGWLKRIVGESGKTVVRGGYSIAYNRQGIGDFRGDFSSNPGVVITANRDLTVGNLVGGSLGSLPLLLRETNRLGPPQFPTEPVYPMTGPPFVATTNSANRYHPNLRVPYSQSWTFGIQRELTNDMVVEARYVGTRNLQGWTEYNLNSVENNIVENGLLNEFRLAQANLAANIAAGRGNTFAYTGVPGTSPLPTTLAYFSGLPAAQASNPVSYTSSNFTSSTFVNTLAANNPNVCCATTGTNISYSGALDAQATFRANALRAGLPANFMLTNPDLRGGANLTSNGGYTRYDSLQVELRRRMSKGLLVQSSYVFAKGFSSSRISFRAPRVNALSTGGEGTLRHAFKVNWVYELPIGQGQRFFNGVPRWFNHIVGGWEFDGAGRVQSGRVVDFGNVRLVGMSEKEFRDLYGLYFDDANRVIYNLPKDIIDNTIKAFSVSATSPTGYGALGPPTGRYIAPANGRDCIQVHSGQCAPQNLCATGPIFTRFDLSFVKRIPMTDRIDFELRGEFLNAFNNINFIPVTGASSSPTLGQVTSAYSDSSNTNDPGGRLGQIVLRINW